MQSEKTLLETKMNELKRQCSDVQAMEEELQNAQMLTRNIQVCLMYPPNVLLAIFTIGPLSVLFERLELLAKVLNLLLFVQNKF